MSRVYGLQCEYKTNPAGLDVPHPRFSWKLESDRGNVKQVAYKLTVVRDADGTSVWTAQLDSDETLHIAYGGPALASNTRYRYKVLSVLDDGEVASSSGADYFETGLLSPALWQAKWIASPQLSPLGQCSIFRKVFHARPTIARARLYASAMGVYELYLNGTRVGDDLLAPGWTSYRSHIQYQCYDVTGQVQAGANALGTRLADGWYCGEFSFNHATRIYGEQPAAMAQLLLEYADGSEECVATDGSWRAERGGVAFSSFYDGEVFDRTREPEGWSRPDFADACWQPARETAAPAARLVGTASQPVRRVEELQPLAILRTPSGETVLDMGQNMVGWVKVRVSGQRGDTVHLKHAEVLDKDGNFYSDNIRDAKQEMRYILRGGGEETLEPHFSFQGFRYVKILAFPGQPTLQNFIGVVVHSDMEQTVRFTCGEPLVNQLWHNILWGQKGNFVDVPTDCPQRDERLGWTGDAQVFCRTAAFNFQSGAFFTKWLADVRADQFANGAVPFVVPNVLPADWRFLTEAGLGFEHTSAGWGDAITICPWTLYRCYGDQRILQQSYDAMKRYIAYIHDGCAHGSGDPYLWDWGPQLGDWLALDNKEGSYRGGTDESLVATAYYAYSADIVGKTAELLGYGEEAAAYRALYGKVVQSFQKNYMRDGGMVQQTQTAHILPLAFGLLGEDEAAPVAARLAALIEENNCHLTTGFLGTPYLCQVLSDHGYGDLAYQLLLQADYPSWLYQVTKGATTIWEHWDGQKPDGSFWSPNMNSFNHYAYGAVGDWLYRCAAGIELDASAPAYRHIRLRPLPYKPLGYVRCSYESACGRISSAWEYKDGDAVEFHFHVPANTTASIFLPGEGAMEVGSGDYSFTRPAPPAGQPDHGRT